MAYPHVQSQMVEKFHSRALTRKGNDACAAVPSAPLAAVVMPQQIHVCALQMLVGSVGGIMTRTTAQTTRETGTLDTASARHAVIPTNSWSLLRCLFAQELQEE